MDAKSDVSVQTYILGFFVLVNDNLSIEPLAGADHAVDTFVSIMVLADPLLGTFTKRLLSDFGPSRGTFAKLYFEPHYLDFEWHEQCPS